MVSIGPRFTTSEGAVIDWLGPLGVLATYLAVTPGVLRLVDCCLLIILFVQCCLFSSICSLMLI